MPPKTKYATTALLLFAGGIYLGTQLGTAPKTALSTDATPEEIARIRSIRKPKPPSADTLPTQATEPTAINALAHLNKAGSDPQTDIRIIEHLLDQVHTVFHELPTGDHREVVAFLGGANPRQIRYIPEGDPNVTAEGEIIDRWGTPYFFHTLSRDRIEVRSAGPDLLHWSGADIVSESQGSSIPKT